MLLMFRVARVLQGVNKIYVMMNVLCRLWKPVLKQLNVLKFHECCRGTFCRSVFL